MLRRSSITLFALASIACSPAISPTDAGSTADAPADASAPERDAAIDGSAEGDALATDATTVEASSADASVDGASADASVGTGGSGGLPCASTGTVSQSGVTYTFCVARVGGVELKIVAPPMDTNPAPLRLAVSLHGDGARAHTGNTTVRLQAPWASMNRAVYVSALAPNACAWCCGRRLRTARRRRRTPTSIGPAKTCARSARRSTRSGAGTTWTCERSCSAARRAERFFSRRAGFPRWVIASAGGYALVCGRARAVVRNARVGRDGPVAQSEESPVVYLRSARRISRGYHWWSELLPRADVHARRARPAQHHALCVRSHRPRRRGLGRLRAVTLRSALASHRLTSG